MITTLRRLLGLDPHAALKQTLGDQELPTFSQSTQAVLRDLRNPDTPMSTIGDRLATDPGLSVTVLRLANRASNGLRRPIADAAHATRLLGRAEIESLVIAAAVKRALPAPQVPGFDPARFWQAAALRATVAKQLADIADPAHARTAFTAALLQDMAVPLLVAARPDGYHELLARTDGTLQEREQDRFGWDHALVAGWVCSAWTLPEELTGVIVQHHQDAAPPAIQVAEYALGRDDEPFVEEARERIGLVPERALSLLDAARIDAQELGSALAG